MPERISYLIIIFLFLNKLNINNSLSINKSIYYYISEIHMVIKGSGTQYMTSKDYGGVEASQVKVNGVTKYGCSKTCYLEKETSNVTLIFSTNVVSCTFMFNHMYNITEVDLSLLDASQIATMFCMFQACINLTKVIFGSIDLSSLVDMYGLFTDCAKLMYVDLSKIDTSRVTDMMGMFNNCPSLIYVDLSNFNTQSLQRMEKMFFDCYSLIYLNLKSFSITSSVNTQNIFGNINSNAKYCITDSTLNGVLASYNHASDCSNICFNQNIKVDYVNKKCIESCQNVKYQEKIICFNECPINNYPIYYNLINVYENPITCYSETPENYYFDSSTKTYKECYDTCKYCNGAGTESYNNCIECRGDLIFLNESSYRTNCYHKCQYYYYFNELNKYQCTDENFCPTKFNKTIISKKKCIDKCHNDDTYKYEYNLTCYIKCPEETLTNETYFFCYQKEIAQSTIIYETETYKIETEEVAPTTTKVEPTEAKPTEAPTTTKVEPTEAKPTEAPTTTQIEQTEAKPTEVQTTTQVEQTETKPTEVDAQTEQAIPTDKNVQTEQITQTELIVAETTQIDSKAQTEQITQTEQEEQIEEMDDPTDFYTRIKKKLIRGDYSNKINNNKDSVYLNKNFIITVTSTKNQENNIYYNSTILYFEECAKKLKEEYNISKNDSLYVIKVDVFFDDFVIPKVEYEVFYPYNETNITQLNLSICKNIKINIRLPLNISKEDIDKYNSSSKLYNDICYSLQNEKGIDKPTKARRDDFIKFNLTRCEEGCQFSEYDIINKAALCSCFTKIKLPILNEIKFDKNKLFANFKNIKNVGNFQMLKCIYLLFDKSKIFINSSNYMNIFLFIISTIGIFIFLCYDRKKLKIFINRIIKENKSINTNINSINIKKTKNFKKNSKKKLIQSTFRKNINPNNNNKYHTFNLNRKRTKKYNLLDLFHNFIKKRYNTQKINNQKKIINQKPYGKRKKNIFTNKPTFHLGIKTSSTINILTKKNKFHNYNDYNDAEMNSLEFGEALREDYRPYCLYYFSLIRCKHILISTFCYFRDYNSQIIKIYMLFFTLVTNVVVSAMFYSESTMNKIYLEDGAFDLTYQLPKMFYSFIISTALKSLLSTLGLYEKSIITIKRNIKGKKGYNNLLFCLKIKLGLFFFFNYIIISAYWIYLGCFCAVYTNTQIHLVKEVLSSFAISLVTPFFVCLLPGVFRVRALDEKSKNKKICLYKFSKFLQLF